MARQILVGRKKVFIVASLLMAMALLILGAGSKAVGPSASGDISFCYSDELLSDSLRANPELQKKMNAQEEAIKTYAEKLSNKRQGSHTATSNYIIPVVVYIVHNGGPENISEQQVNSQIAALNNAFSGRGVEFCLATTQGGTPLPGSPTPGIIRIQSALTDHLTSQENALKALSPLPGDKYLRIWVVRNIDNGTPTSGVVGYARFPGSVSPSLEGIVMRYDVFGDVATCGCSNLIPNYDRGKVLAHEVGHYLYLYHTFQGGCTGVFGTDCATAGDRVCDTPQIAVGDSGCPASQVLSCDGTPALLDNEMDYTNDVCRNTFTAGQDSRMLATLNTVRQQLISPANLVFTGVQCAGQFNAIFVASNFNPCTNQGVTFDALNVNGASYLWDFGDNSAGSGDPVTHTYTTAGTFSVTLTVTTGGNSVSSTQQVFVTACAPINSSQGNWYFGGNAGLNFSTGAPVAVLDNGISFTEACVTQSDAAGNLLFYSNGVKVFDRSHVQMAPGTQLIGDPSASNGLISIPDPASANRYYLIYITGNLPNGNNLLRYTIVDFADPQFPNGKLTSIDTLISPGSGFGEAVTAIPRCGGTGYWVIAQAPATLNFYVYSLTASGITFSSTYPVALPSDIGILKASPDGTMLAQTGQSHDAAVFSFDRSTGAIMLRSNLSLGNCGCSFSPDSKVLYTAGNSIFGVGIFQYDLTVPNPNATVQVVTDSLIAAFGFVTLQLGPDKKIYASQWGPGGGGVGFLPVINYPNQRNTPVAPNACGYNLNGVSLQGRNTYIGLPNMIDALPPAQIPADFSYGISSCSTVNFSAPSCATYAWNFGDSTTSNAQNPTHTYAVNGTYTVTLTLNGSTSVSHTIVIGLPASSLTIFGPSQVCLASGPPIYNYSVNGQPGLTYNWTVIGGSISGLNGGDNVNVVWTTLPGTVQLTATDSATGCTAMKTLAVIQNCSPCPTPIVLTPSVLAKGLIGAIYAQTLTASGACQPYTFSVSGGPLPSGLTLSPTGVISGTPTQGGSFSVTIKVVDSCGCMLERSYLLIICPAVTRPRTYRAGNMDDFMLPTDSASPSLALKAAFPGAIWKNFDDVSIDKWVGHTFTSLPANIVKAELEVQMKPGQSSLSSNDSINLLFSPPMVAWGIHMADIVPWGPGQSPNKFVFDLANLPITANGTVNLLNDLAAQRYVDVAIQDDTTVDYIKLRVWTCPPPRIFFGLGNEVLGQAQLALNTNGSLVVSNLGASGLDGVRVQTYQAEGICVAFAQSLCMGVGTAMDLVASGNVGDVGGAAHLKFVYNSITHLVDITADFPYNPGGCVHVFVLNDGGCIPVGTVLASVPPDACIKEVDWIKFNDIEAGFSLLFDSATNITVPGVGHFSSNRISFTPDLPVGEHKQFISSFDVLTTNISSFTIVGEKLQSFGLFVGVVGGAIFEPFDGGLAVANIDSSGNDGVMIDLGKAESCDFSLDPLDLQGSANVGSYIQVAATGLLDGVPNRSLGNFRVTKTNTAYLITADLSAVAPLQRIQIFNGSTLVLDQPGHTGPAGASSAWPRQIGKLGGQTDCITSHYPPGTTFSVDGTTYHGDQFNVLADGVGGTIGFKSAFTIQAAGLAEFTIAGAEIVACGPPIITCPANMTKATSPGQCSAVTTYLITATPKCGSATVLCSPASGSVFPIGTTTVNCTATDTAGNAASCSFTVRVFDTEPPMFANGCPPVTKTAQASCPIATSALVNYAMPVATDNCPGATVSCNPPPGSMFAVGTTVVTCTATDGSGNTAQCTFPVNVFSFCLQDDSNAGNVALVNALTGDYSFCCGGVLIATGRGTLTIRGCIGSIDQIKGDRRVHIQWDTSANSGAGAGTASVQKLGGILCQIADKKLSNNSCQCF